jgi:ammonia channel protein AmtB
VSRSRASWTLLIRFSLRLDWAGGDVVHVSSGTAALAYSFYLGQRVGYGKSLSASYRPGSVAFVVLGTAMMLFGWVSRLSLTFNTLTDRSVARIQRVRLQSKRRLS